MAHRKATVAQASGGGGANGGMGWLATCAAALRQWALCSAGAAVAEGAAEASEFDALWAMAQSVRHT
jgi:hypothetical protein